MSREDLTPLNPAHEVVVGWDPPLQTYFAQVLNTKADELSDDYTVLWLGTSFAEVRTAQAVIEAVRPYADIHDGVLEELLQACVDDQ